MKIATHNMGDGSDQMKGRGLDRLVTHGADVIGLQEAGDRSHMLQMWCKFNDWDLWLGDGSPGATSTPILWNPATVRALRKGTTPATPATNTGKLGAGPSVVKPKVWNRVRFDGPVVVINGHLPASLYLPKRRALAKKQVDVLARVVEKRKGHVPVVVTMDGNCEDDDRLWKPLRALGMHQHTKAPTHGRRTIDLTWTLGVTGSTEVIAMPSDHRAAILTLR